MSSQKNEKKYAEKSYDCWNKNILVDHKYLHSKLFKFCLFSNFRSMIGPSLEQLSLVQHQILNRPDYMERRVMQLMQVAVFVLYSIHTRDEHWHPYFKILLKHECNTLWMWSEAELKELQDEKLVRKAVKWKEMISMLAANLTPKLNSFGMFAGKDLDPDTLVRFQ